MCILLHIASLDIAPSGITSNAVQTIDSPLNRQYITARDLVTDYDLSSRGLQSDAGTKEVSNDTAETREKQNKDGAHATLKEEVKKGVSTDMHGQINTKVDGISSKKHAESSKTPRNNGFFVNLSDGSGKISTR